MKKPAPTDLVYIVVTESPNRVWAAVNGHFHSARFRTTQTEGQLRDVQGNGDLLNAALLAWEGQDCFVLSFSELEARSQGWGAWAETPDELGLS